MRICLRLLGIKINFKLMFDSHVKSPCKKEKKKKQTSKKLSALLRVAYQLDFNQRKLVLDAFITSQFSCALVLWMLNLHANC